VDPDRAAKPKIPKKDKRQKTQEDNECGVNGKVEIKNAEAYEAKT
jgi:hypothetical protein